MDTAVKLQGIRPGVHRNQPDCSGHTPSNRLPARVKVFDVTEAVEVRWKRRAWGTTRVCGVRAWARLRSRH